MDEDPDLRASGLRSVAILPLGYREADKGLAGQPDQGTPPARAVRHRSLILCALGVIPTEERKA